MITGVIHSLLSYFRGGAKRSLVVCSLLCGLVFGVAERADAQYVALKSNLLYAAALTPNISLEFRLAPRWTLQLGAGFNPWPREDEADHKWRHVMAYVEPRYWFCSAFSRDFIALNAAYTHFNVAEGLYPIGWLYKDVQNNRLQGDAVMAGVSYGWHFIVSPHVSFELEAGVDGGYAWMDRFACGHCGSLTDSPRKWFAAPKAAVNIVVMLR